MYGYHIKGNINSQSHSQLEGQQGLRPRTLLQKAFLKRRMKHS